MRRVSAEAQSELRDAADELDDAKPPGAVAKQNDQLVAGMRAYADDLEELRGAAERGDSAGVTRFNRVDVAEPGGATDRGGRGRDEVRGLRPRSASPRNSLRLLIVNPFASAVTEERIEQVAARAGRRRDSAHRASRSRDRACPRGPRRRGGVRLLRRRRLQRGAERDRRGDSRRLRPRRRRQRAAARARPAQRCRSARRSASSPAAPGESRSAASTGVDSDSPPASVSTPRRSAASRRVAAGRTARAPATPSSPGSSPACSPSGGGASSPRWRSWAAAGRPSPWSQTGIRTRMRGRFRSASRPRPASSSASTWSPRAASRR